MKERRKKICAGVPSESFPDPCIRRGRAGPFLLCWSDEAHEETGETPREQPRARKLLRGPARSMERDSRTG